MTYTEQRAIELAEIKQYNETLPAVAAAVAKEMGEGWHHQIKSDGLGHARFILLGPARESIHFSSTWNDASRFVITGEYPRDAAGRYFKPFGISQPSIRVAISKPPTMIAKDIKRRFLPDYLALLSQVIEQNDKNDAHESARHSVLHSIAAILGARIGEPLGIYLHMGCVYGSITASATSVRMDLSSIPVDLAKAIASLVATYVEAAKA